MISLKGTSVVHSAMEYIQRRPAPPLNSFIQSIWYTRSQQTLHSRERILPNGSLQIVINLARDHILHCSPDSASTSSVCMKPALIAGVHSQYMVIDTSDLSEMMGIQFWPGGFVPLLGTPANLFTNTHMAMEEVFGRYAETLRERLQAAPTPLKKLSVLESSMLARISTSASAHRGVRFAVNRFSQSPHRDSVLDVVRQVGLSPRRFAQVFREQIGVTPKLYCRIRRFQQAVSQIYAGNDVNWANLALSCGYFDQSHFANDFRAFSGLTPASYEARRAKWMNHVAFDA